MDRFESTCLIVEVSQIIVHEADEPDVLVDLFDSDFLAGEDLAEIDLVSVEADPAAGGHDDGLVMEGVVELGQTSIGPE